MKGWFMPWCVGRWELAAQCLVLAVVVGHAATFGRGLELRELRGLLLRLDAVLTSLRRQGLSLEKLEADAQVTLEVPLPT